jgi:hypothetical protein
MKEEYEKNENKCTKNNNRSNKIATIFLNFVKS